MFTIIIAFGVGYKYGWLAGLAALVIMNTAEKLSEINDKLSAIQAKEEEADDNEMVAEY